MSIKGEFWLDGLGVAGWARDDALDRPLWLEMLVDGEIMASVLADLPEPEACGFWLPLPVAPLENGAEILVRPANSLEALGPPIKCGKAGESGLLGEVYVDKGLTISGWALDSAQPEKALKVIAGENGRELASALACRRRYRPENGDGHGFLLNLPLELADGEEHLIQIQDDRRRQLPGSPIRIRTFPQNAAQWLKGRPRLEKAEKDTLENLLEYMERRLPGASGQLDYEAWKKAFPTAKKNISGKISIHAPGAGQAFLKKQAGGDFRPGDRGADFVFLMARDTEPHPYALAHMVAEARESGANLVYADAEDAGGHPFFKPAWDEERFLAQDYLGPLLVRSDFFREIPPCENMPALRLKLAMLANGRVRHIPAILSRENRAEPVEERLSLVQDWLAEMKPGSCAEMAGGSIRIRRPLPERPSVSIIIPTRDRADLLSACLKSLEKTQWPDLEIIIVDNDSREEDTLALLREAGARPGICISRQPGVFNYSKLNNEAAARARGKLLCFMNNDIEALSPDWLEEMAGMLLDCGAGCVGAKLLWPNGLVQHGGVIVGVHGLAAHIGNQWLADEPGYMGANLLARRCSAVTAAAMLTTKRLFFELGGFDPLSFPVAFNDVDYCLKVAASGGKIFWTPFARLSHHESASRGADERFQDQARSRREAARFRARWGAYEDPYYNPNLPLSAVVDPFEGLAFPPRDRKPR